MKTIGKKIGVVKKLRRIQEKVYMCVWVRVVVPVCTVCVCVCVCVVWYFIITFLWLSMSGHNFNQCA